MTKRDLFLWYVQMEAWRNRGAGWIATAYSWLSISALKDAFLLGGIAKLTVLKDMPMPIFMMIVFLAGLFMEFVKIFIGWFDFKNGIWKIQNEWSSKHETNNPFGNEMKDQLKAIAEKVGAEIKFKDL